MSEQDAESLNLSEKLFCRVRRIEETSMISNSADFTPVQEPCEQVLIEGLCSSAWYRLLRRSYWIWQGADPIELEETLARIAHADAPRTHNA